MRFFSLDSAFHKYGTILFDLIVLNVLWLVIAFGTFGILAPFASAAMFNSINHTLVKEDGYLMKSFFTVFRRKFLRGLAFSIISSVALAGAAYNIVIAYQANVTLLNALIFLYIMIFAELMITIIYGSALLAETDMTIKLLFKYGFLLTNKHFLVSISFIAVMAAVAYFGIFVNLLFILAGVAPLFWFMGWMIQTKVFDKYYLDKLV